MAWQPQRQEWKEEMERREEREIKGARWDSRREGKVHKRKMKEEKKGNKEKEKREGK
jgi:hypothetical protein